MKDVYQTLSEQMQISERELGHRKQLLDFDEEENRTLSLHRPFIHEHVDEIVENFYARQLTEPEISLLIGDADTLLRLRGAMRHYILELFSGQYDLEYVNRRLRIGKVHKRIGVSPKLFISAIWLLKKGLCDAIDKHIANGSNEILKQSINKLLMLDTQFVFDTYISSLVSEVENAKEQLEIHVASLEDKVADRTRQLEELSRRDGLTGLYNQRAFFENLRRELCQAERHHDCLSLIYLDLNGFKNLNDQEGHLAGDTALSQVGQAILENSRKGDYPCRYGGDEFCIILPRTSLKVAEGICVRIEELFAKHLTYSLSFSAGIAATGPDTFIDADDLVKQADRLMYQAKEISHLQPGFHIVIDQT